ncbi:2-hydroxyacid dehydrogenase [Kyrpidia sp.]|uniref:2-hydroxyacid dehydrogenase n=1 Tax=Kyrpidia sp. TaxID=2073077 RepID=UPI00258447A9|nr:2-hydroxyacid dehydrogenase [Kyrpidia sp.]MCL6575001.1 2-hydroxyacid dehydrogenase [Kyrpidia sp.]
MNIALVGDGFVHADIMEAVFRELFPNDTYVKLEVDWPSRPFQRNDEVVEYVGDPSELSSVVKQADVLVVSVAPVTRAMIESSPNLKIIGCTRGGPVNVNIAAAHDHNIPVVFAPGRNAAATAEYTIGMLLAGLRNIGHGHAALSQGRWVHEFYLYENVGFELDGKVAGVIGFGNVGQRVAYVLKSLGCTVLCYDPWVPPSAIAAAGVSPVERLEELLPQVDLLTLHARQTAENYHMISEEQLARMKPSAFLVNTSRGGLLDYDALFRSLSAGRLRGAALDVFEEEPPPLDHPLLRLPNVTVTPHIAGATRETAARGTQLVAEAVRELLNGGRPNNCKFPDGWSAKGKVG